MQTNAPTPPPQAILMQMITGGWVSQAIAAAATLGVADELRDGPRTAAELAARTGCHAPSLFRLLRALASLGLFTMEEGPAQEGSAARFGLTPLGEPLRGDVPGSLRGMARYLGLDAARRAWSELPYSVRTGEPAFDHVHGTSGFAYLAAHPADSAIFNEAMSGNISMARAAVAGAYDFSGLGTLVDVGGGHGALLTHLLEANPSLRGVLFDQPHVLEGARVGSSLGDRLRLVGGDFFAGVPAGDGYVLSHIIHDWDDERSVRILRAIRAAAAPGARLLLVEMVLPPGNEPHFGKLLDLEMLVITAGGRERTRDEYAALYTAAGFRLDRVIPTAGPLSILEGTAV